MFHWCCRTTVRVVPCVLSAIPLQCKHNKGWLQHQVYIYIYQCTKIIMELFCFYYLHDNNSNANVVHLRQKRRGVAQNTAAHIILVYKEDCSVCGRGELHCHLQSINQPLSLSLSRVCYYLECWKLATRSAYQFIIMSKASKWLMAQLWSIIIIITWCVMTAMLFVGQGWWR